MPRRKIPIVNNEIYHIFNRSIALEPIFRNTVDYKRGLELIDYYRFNYPPKRYSHYNRMPMEDKKALLKNLYDNGEKLVDIYSFALMPNHYHFLVKQLKNNGVSRFLRLFQDSYAKYLNTKSARFGSVFQNMFKVVRIETDEQLLHVSRYIHLNPLTSYVIKNNAILDSYTWNSYIDYISGKPRSFINTNILFNYFKTKKNMSEFTLNHLEYQRSLNRIKHLIHE